MQDITFTGRFNMYKKSSVVQNTFGTFQERNKLTFLQSTLKEAGTQIFPRFALPVDSAGIGSFNGEPWTAFEAIKWVMLTGIPNNHFPGLAHPVFDMNLLPDNKRELKNVRFEETGFMDVLGRLMVLAGAQLCIRPDGVWQFYDAYGDPPMASGAWGGYSGAGFVEKTDFSRIRPQNVRVKVPIVREVMLQFSNTGDGKTIQRNASQPSDILKVENVFPMHIDVTGVPLGIGDLVRGQWVTLDVWAEAMNHVGWLPNLVGLTNGRLEPHDLNGAVMNRAKFMEYAKDINQPDMIDDEIQTRVATFAKHWRSTFQINPKLMNYTLDWSPYRAALGDPTTGQRKKSPVWIDHIYWPSGKIVLKPNNGTGLGPMAVPKAHPATDLDLRTAKVAPFEVSIIDKALGIFSVDPHPSLHDTYTEILVGTLATPFEIDLRRFDPSGARSQINLDNTYKMTTIISMRLNTPNDSRSYQTFTSSLTQAGMPNANGQTFFDTVFEGQPARREWIPGFTTHATGPNNELLFTGDDLVNDEVLEDAVQGIVWQIAASYADRVVGKFGKADFDPVNDIPSGNASWVGVSMSGTGEFQTVGRCPNPIHMPSLAELLPEKSRRVLYAELDKTALDD
jgi:hypothetical protein